jgi:hypothetical protein
MGLLEGYCRMSFTPDTQAALGHLVFVLAGVAAEFVVFAAATLLHYRALWPPGGFFLGLYKGLTIYNLIVIAVSLYPHDGSDGEKALSMISELRRRPEEVPNDPNEQ